MVKNLGFDRFREQPLHHPSFRLGNPPRVPANRSAQVGMTAPLAVHGALPCAVGPEYLDRHIITDTKTIAAEPELGPPFLIEERRIGEIGELYDRGHTDTAMGYVRPSLVPSLDFHPCPHPGIGKLPVGKR